MDFADKAKRNRKAFSDPMQAMFHCGDVVRNLLNVVEGNARSLLAFVKQQIGEGRLCSFYLR